VLVGGERRRGGGAHAPAGVVEIALGAMSPRESLSAASNSRPAASASSLAPAKARWAASSSSA